MSPVEKYLVPTEDEEFIDGEIVPMTFELARFWTTKVQPVIKNNYHPASQRDDNFTRADTQWDWRTWLVLSWVQTIFFSDVKADSKSGISKARCLVVKSELGKIAPIGMLIYVPKFGCTVGEKFEHRNFIWFFSDIPKEASRQLFKINRFRLIPRLLLHTAVTDRTDTNNSNEAILHADPNGGERLINKYMVNYKMTRLVDQKKPISRSRRRDLKNYLYWTEDAITDFTKTIKPYIPLQTTSQ